MNTRAYRRKIQIEMKKQALKNARRELQRQQEFKAYEKTQVNTMAEKR